MLGGLLFSSYFIGLNPLIRVLTPPLDPASVPALKMLVSCAAALCLAGGPVGLLALGRSAAGGERYSASRARASCCSDSALTSSAAFTFTTSPYKH
jgi:hypothetical protein